MPNYKSSDLQQLKRVLVMTEEVLQKVTGPWANRLLSKDTGEDIEQAWPDIKRTLDRLRRELDRPSGELTEKLQQSGLAGKPLKVETTGLFKWFNRFRRDRSRRAVKKFFKWLNIILGSLASCLPAGELLKQYKESIEQSMDDAEDDSLDKA